MGAFLWNQREHHPAHWVAWKKVCQPISQGGLRARSVPEVWSQFWRYKGPPYGRTLHVYGARFIHTFESYKISVIGELVKAIFRFGAVIGVVKF